MMKTNGNKSTIQLMQNNNQKPDELTAKIMKGLELTFKKLLETKRKNNGTLVFWENGVIKKIKAVDFVDTRKT
jgi:hypothetical protein